MAVIPPVTFHTRRLLLRPVTLADAEAIFTAYAQDPEVTRYVIWSPHRHIGDTASFSSAASTAGRLDRNLPGRSACPTAP